MRFLLILPILMLLLPSTLLAEDAAPQPNILWITCEDISANLGCYGDKLAKTPRLDAFAKEGVLFTNVYASAPVCSPARSCIITGVHACSLGTQHLRSKTPLAEGVKCYSEYLRGAGYYCTNNVKEDYQFTTPSGAWAESSKKAHWKNRRKGKPFFAIFNLTLTHQSQTRYGAEELQKRNAALPKELRHDPAKLVLPPYYPDTPVVRNNLAAYYTQITLLDIEVGKLLDELDEAGLTDETIVFFYSDHGAGLPRHKRWLHRSGLHVPMMVRCPKKFQHLIHDPQGSKCDRLVSFADLAPTVLNLAGLPIPKYMQGQPFLGKNLPAPREYVFASRDRVDEVLLCSRTVIDKRYQYIRNFYPHRARMPLSWYSEKTPIRQEVRRLGAAGKLKEEGDGWLYAKTTPPEELYDIQKDPDEMNNLIGSPQHQEVAKKMRMALLTWMTKVRDTGLFPESQMQHHWRKHNLSPYTMLEKYPGGYENILAVADLVGRGKGHLKTLTEKLAFKPLPTVRYWAAVGLLNLGDDAKPSVEALKKALTDDAPSVRIVAAESLCKLGERKLGFPVLLQEYKSRDLYTALEAGAAIQDIAPLSEKEKEQFMETKAIRAQYLQWGREHILEGK